ncbi:MAG: hypothetical protein JWN87_2686 [Frankiales bacterium]|jgi:pimeloyl-ACP methyl ester carboxylesterase|nr:hypothetical protein [Frankiales bacterium]
MSGPTRGRRTALLLGLAWTANQVRWARHTRPEPLPPPPAGSHTLTTADGTRLHAQVGGRADATTTVVLIHGFLARTLEFDMQWNSLGDRARLIRYDHRNHGRSDHTGDPITVETLAGDLAAVITELAPSGKVVLVGHSMGGMTTLGLAAFHPDLFAERVAGVALLATGAGHFIEGHRWENLFRWASRRHLLAAHLLGIRLVAPVLEQLRPRRTHVMRRATRKVIFGSDDVDPATLTMTQALLEEPPLATLASLHGSLLRNDALEALAMLRTVPVAVITGGEDKLTRPEHSARMAADIGPTAELVTIPGAGHVLNQTRPVEVNAALHRLLDRVDVVGAGTARTSRLA